MYGSFIPISLITFIYPSLPTAFPTSNFPISFKGKSTCGFPTKAFTLGKLFATATIIPIGPDPFICKVNLSCVFFISVPIITAIVIVLPNAAVASGLKS